LEWNVGVRNTEAAPFWGGVDVLDIDDGVPEVGPRVRDPEWQERAAGSHTQELILD